MTEELMFKIRETYEDIVVCLVGMLQNISKDMKTGIRAGRNYGDLKIQLDRWITLYEILKRLLADSFYKFVLAAKSKNDKVA